MGHLETFFQNIIDKRELDIVLPAMETSTGTASDVMETEELAEEIRKAFGGKGTSAYGVVSYYKKLDFLEERGTGKSKEYHIKE